MADHHTPTPWVADDGDGQYFIIAHEETGDAVAVLVDPISVGGHDILLPRDENYAKAARGEGQFELVYSRYPEHKANAAFIVKAVNNHTPMIKALSDCLGCVTAAETEGLHELIVELRGSSESVDRLIDLIDRRLLWVREYAQPVLAKLAEKLSNA